MLYLIVFILYMDELFKNSLQFQSEFAMHLNQFDSKFLFFNFITTESQMLSAPVLQ